MLMVISPSKSQDFSAECFSKSYSEPALLNQSNDLITELRNYPIGHLTTLMGISTKLATLNHQRFKDFSPPFTKDNATQAIFAFKGDTYSGIEIAHYDEEDYQFLQQHLRIISGFYGMLRPLDLIQAYRLEMKTKLANKKGKDLYQFWGTKLTELVNEALKEQGDTVLINLASNEYWKAFQPDQIQGTIITPVFKDQKKGTYKVIGLFAKRARGMMVDYITKKRITKSEDIKQFDVAGYRFDPNTSTEYEFIFLRDEVA